MNIRITNSSKKKLGSSNKSSSQKKKKSTNLRKNLNKLKFRRREQRMKKLMKKSFHLRKLSLS